MFLEVGGYLSALRFYFEESHLSVQAYREGRGIFLFPSLVVHHEKTFSARNTGKIAFYIGRNRVLLVLWYYPLRTIPIRLATSLPGTLALVRPRDYPAAIIGFPGRHFRRGANDWASAGLSARSNFDPGGICPHATIREMPSPPAEIPTSSRSIPRRLRICRLRPFGPDSSSCSRDPGGRSPAPEGR